MLYTSTDQVNSFDARICPTPAQQLLLKAALLEDSKAVGVWEDWKRVVKFEDIDPSSYRLLPLVYRNLIDLGIQNEPLLHKLKGVHHHTWSTNQLLINSAAKLLRVFETAGVKTLLLKGSAMLLLYYRDFGLRPMKDLDLLVPPEQNLNACELLEKCGYKPKNPRWKVQMPFLNSFAYTDGAGRQIDLHWYVFKECRQKNADLEFWEQSQSVKIQDQSTRVLSSADQLLHISVHGIAWSRIPSIWWIADAVTILDSSRTSFDWDRFLAQSRERRFIAIVKEALRFLTLFRENLIPAEVLKEIDRTPVSVLERKEFECRIRNSKWSIWGRFPKLWLDYQRHTDDHTFFRKLGGFVDYLRKFYGVRSRFYLPLFLLFVALRRPMRLLAYYCFKLPKSRYKKAKFLSSKSSK